MIHKSERRQTESHPGSPELPNILATKLYIPPTRAEAVARPVLVGKLLSGADRLGNFALVSGPAGFGKTTLLSEFVPRCKHPTAWVSLDAGDNDPAQFWSYVIAACQSILEDVGESALELIRTPQPLPDEAIPTLLINDLTAHGGSIVLILDDYHTIKSEHIHNGLLFLLDHLPPNLHIIISTRADPPWPLVRFRARNQLVEVRAQDLRFNEEEAGTFLNHTMGLGLSGEDVAALEARTEGWIAGLQLAALSLQGRRDVSAFIRDFTGSHVYIAEYLIEEILHAQPDDVQRFLLQTSLLERMNGGLCESVTECPDGQAMLMALRRANIFLVPLDSEAQWFRYHHLFADLLRARLRQHLSDDEIARLHLRAADWYEGNGLIPEAVHHALAAEDYERTAVLVDRVGQTMMFTDQYMTLKGWLDALPDAYFDTYPRLEIYRALIELNLGTMDMYEETLREKEALVKALPPSPENDRLRLEALVCLSLFMAHQNTGRAIQMAREALAELPDENLKLRAFLYSALYRAHGMEGDIEKSAPAYRECLRLAQMAGQYSMISNTTMVRAFDLCQYGRLEEAARYCQEILDMGDDLGRRVFYPAGTACIGLGGIHLERFELEAAEDYLSRGLELCHQGGTYGLYTGYLQQARLLQAKGDLDGAWETLCKLEKTLKRRDFTLTARQVSIRLAMNDVAGASRLIEPLREIFEGTTYSRDLPLIASEAFNLSLARIFIAQSELAQSIQLLDEIEATVEPGQRYGRLMEVYLLRALAAQQTGYTEVALHHLVRALELGHPAGFVLLFVEEGPVVVPLLEAIRVDQTVPDHLRSYARTLLSAFAGQTSASTPDVDLIEPLTPREMEVLQLVAAGASNQAIADELVISLRTVKKHISNILGKLEVDNRMQAAIRARELGLIPD